MMNEYNNNFNNNSGFYTDGNFNEQSESSKSKKSFKRTAAKFTAGIMAMAMVSFGSVSIYRAFEKDSTSTTKIVTEYVEKSSSSGITADNMSLLGTNNTATGTALETEDIVDALLPSVVGIESEFTYPQQSYGGMFGYGMGNSSKTATGTGTGVIISEDGYIVTNAHVIYDSEYGCGLSTNITVLLSDDSEYDAEVIGYDTDYDLAVLKIKETGLTAAEFGNSDALRLGESVIAIGNPLGFDLKNTVTSGIISGLDRKISINDQSMNLIQTDAAINSGNSGGPLINKYGQVIGINSSKMSSSYSGASIDNIGFAIPSNEAARIVKDLIDHGYVTGKPQLGINYENVTESDSYRYNIPVGVYVTSVEEGSAAEKAGLRSGDVITAIDGTEIKTGEELTAQKNLHSAGDTVSITFTRSGSSKTVELTLDEASNQ
jgi:serine protease Do